MLWFGKKINIKIKNSLIGKSREEIICIYGDNFLTDSSQEQFIYIIEKSWSCPMGFALVIDFNLKGSVQIAFIMRIDKSWDLKRHM